MVFCVLSQQRLKKQLERFFASLYSKRTSVSFSLDNFPFSVLSQEYATQFTIPFLDAEVLTALTSCGSTKALGLDGFNFYIYKSAWSFLKYDLINVFSKFFRTGKLPKGINSVSLVLIPKVPKTQNLSKFR